VTSKTDLHMHSNVSDGLMSPSAVVSYAAERGVRLMALTDHDTVAGLADAGPRATELGVRLINGVEISASWGAHSLHVVGLDIDPGHSVLAAGLEQQQARRLARAEEICEKLARRGIDGVWQGVRAERAGRLITRMHIARFLTAAGHVRDPRQAFKKHLGTGKRAHVSDHWASLETVIGWIRDAGGVAVLAHPARYRLGYRRLQVLLGEFAESGGVALEVASGCHSEEETRMMVQHARQAGLLASTGSDFHEPGLSFRQPGQVPPLPAECTPLWQELRWI
jgi:predicted metal-dependent phosphoesterase TrpH